MLLLAPVVHSDVLGGLNPCLYSSEQLQPLAVTTLEITFDCSHALLPGVLDTG